MSSASAPLSAPLAARAGRAGRLAGSPTLRFIVRRLLMAIPVLFGVTFVSFVVMNSLPGDAAQELLGRQRDAVRDPPARDQARARQAVPHAVLGLAARGCHWASRPLAVERSERQLDPRRRPAGQFELVAFAFVISLVLAVPLALLSARKPNGIADRLTMMFSMAGLSIAPTCSRSYWYTCSRVKLNVLPRDRVGPARAELRPEHPLSDPAVRVDRAPPALLLHAPAAGGPARADAEEDYVVTARAKGVRPWRVLTRHALRNSLFGLITVVALNLGTLLGATVVIEDIFGIPGHRSRVAPGDRQPRHPGDRGHRVCVRA